MQADDDLAALQACLAGTPGAWEAFVDRFAPYLAEVSRSTLAAYGRPAGPQEVADALQDLSLRLLEQDLKALRAYRWHGSVAAYLAAIAVSRIKDRKPPPAHRSLPTEAASPSPGPGETLEKREDLERLRKALDQLPPRTRLALALQGNGAGLREIAGALGITEDAAAQILSRAKATLRERLEENP